jgi:hypothetical protein
MVKWVLYELDFSQNEEEGRKTQPGTYLKLRKPVSN